MSELRIVPPASDSSESNQSMFSDLEEAETRFGPGRLAAETIADFYRELPTIEKLGAESYLQSISTQPSDIGQAHSRPERLVKLFQIREEIYDEDRPEAITRNFLKEIVYQSAVIETRNVGIQTDEEAV